MIFPQPKGALDEGWYLIEFGEALTALLNPVAVSVVHLTYVPPLQPVPLIASQSQLAPDSLGSANSAVAFYVAGGDAGGAYLLTASASTAAGGKRYASAVLQVR